MSARTFNEMLDNSLNIQKNTSEQAIQQEKEKNKALATDISQNSNSDYIYPSLIIIPLIIVIITTLTLHINLLTKFIIILFLLISLFCYIMQYKKINISDPLNKMSKKLTIGTSRERKQFIFSE